MQVLSRSGGGPQNFSIPIAQDQFGLPVRFNHQAGVGRSVLVKKNQSGLILRKQRQKRAMHTVLAEQSVRIACGFR